MAAGLTENDKQIGLTQAWHGLTEVVEEINPNDNWLTKWDIEPVPTYMNIGDEQVELPFKILQSTDLKLPIGRPFAKTYSPISNKQFMSLVQQIVDEYEGIKIESLGSVCNRGRVFVSLSVEEAKKYSTGGRDFEDYLNFGNAHDQSSIMWVNNTNICTVCNNTFNYNMTSNNKGMNVRIIHRGNVDIKLENVKDVIDTYIESQNIFKKKFDDLALNTISVQSAMNLYKGWLTRYTNSEASKMQDKTRISARIGYNVQRLTDLFENGKGNAGQNLSDVFSAVTDFYTHESSVRGKNIKRQFVSSEFGTANASKQDFWNVVNNPVKIEEYIKAGEQLTLVA